MKALPIRNTDEQRAIVDKAGVNADLLIWATAGCGKTYTLGRYATAYAKDHDTRGMVCVTYSRPGKTALQGVLDTFCKAMKLSRIEVVTFQEWSGRIMVSLERQGVLEERRLKDVGDDSEALPYLDEALQMLAEASTDGLGDIAYWSRGELFKALNLLKFNMRLHDLLSEEYGNAEIADMLDVPVPLVNVFTVYEQLRKRYGFRTYVDTLYDTVIALLENPQAMDFSGIRRIVVDEFHDTNEAQLRLLACVSSGGGRLIAAGDDHQAINVWQGASPEIMRTRCPELFAGILTMPLTETFRFGPTTSKAINNLMTHAPGRPAIKAISNTLHDTRIEVAVAAEMGQAVVRAIDAWFNAAPDPGTVAVIVRSQEDSIETAIALIDAGYPIIPDGVKPFYEWDEINALKGYLLYGLNDLASVPANARERIVLATLDILPVLGDEGEKKTIAGEVAAHPDLLDLYPQNILRRVRETNGDAVAVARAQRIERAARFARDNIARLDAAEILEGLIANLDLKGEAVRRHLRPELAASAVRGLTGIVKLARQCGGGARAFITYLDRVAGRVARASRPAVRMATPASAKGKQFDHVILPNLEQGRFPLSGADGQVERRLFYVAVTRARKQLTLLVPETGQLSRYVSDMNIDEAHKEGRKVMSGRHKHYLSVPFADTQEALMRGAKYDQDVRLHYVPDHLDPRDFKKWLIE